jgi:hypothetical protein
VTARTEYVVRWRRQGWGQSQFRLFQSEPPARELLAKLQGRGRPELRPLVVLRFERRRVGAWEVVR